MAVTVANIITNLDTYLGDTSTDRVSEPERFQAITESTVWLLEELGNEHMVNTYNLEFLDTINYYKVTTPLADLLIGADLRREKENHFQAFQRKAPREAAEDIGQGSLEPFWAIDRKDGDAYLVVNFSPENIATNITSFDSTTEGGTWTADTTNSDATNLTQDTNEKKQGSASLNFDIDVSQSGNDYATIYANDSTSRDLSDHEDLSSFIMEVYIPDVTDTTSFTLFWSSDEDTTPSAKSNYWSVTTTTDVDGNSFVDGWNKIKFNWPDASKTGSPDSGAIVYYEIRMTYAGGQGDDTDFRYDHLRLAKPETLTFYYISWNVGTDTNGSDITAFSATTDIPFFSDLYDNYKYAVAHKAASILYYSALQLPDMGSSEEARAIENLQRYQKRFESSLVRETRNFKVLGVNLRNRWRRRAPRIR